MTEDQHAAVLLALRVNARRGHFAEAYEGFNDCPAPSGRKCDCGNAEAVAALRTLGLCPHVSFTLRSDAGAWVCGECGEPEDG